MKAYSDLSHSLRHWRIWYTLALQDIKLRYRRSVIGPFWITISMAITIYSMGFLYSHLFHTDMREYFPYLTSGIICWSLISTLLIDSTNVFIEAEAYIKNINLPYTLFPLRMILRNFIIFAHNILAYIPILIFFHTDINFKILLIFPGLLIIGLNALFFCPIIGMLGTRFRDLAQIITSLVQVIFFLTPIMWMPNLLASKYQWFFELNPFNQFLNLIRYPLMGQSISLNNVIIVLAVTVFGGILFTATFNRYRTRIVFWL